MSTSYSNFTYCYWYLFHMLSPIENYEFRTIVILQRYRYSIWHVI